MLLSLPAAHISFLWAAGTFSAGLALAGIHAQTGKSSQLDFQSNMLAEFFDRPTLANSQYPPTVWIFLNEASPNGIEGLTRKQELIQTWIQVKRIDSLASTEKSDRVTSQPSELLKLSIDDFEDRAAMLQDIRARISYLKRDLGALLTSLPPSVTHSSHAIYGSALTIRILKRRSLLREFVLAVERLDLSRLVG